METITTKHGYERVVERSKRKDVTAYADRAMRNGKKPEVFTHPKFKAYLEKVASRSVVGAQIRVFSNQIFVFSPCNELVTVLDIPDVYDTRKYKK